MRIKQSKLGEPECEYTRMNNGEQVILRLYNKPQKCVTVIRGKDKQCYPLTNEQYAMYVSDALMYLNPDKDNLTQAHAYWTDKAGTESNEHLKQFYANVAQCYKRRLENA